ncbi:MAG: HEPN domain-containing protein [bacterium]|nr:HEPN domain-containing protein [bacterium]
MSAVQDLIAKAERFLRTAEKAIELGDYDTCASRCYYAMFYLAEAALLTRGITASSHKGVITLFGQHFVKPGTLPRDLGKALAEAYDKRLIGDYATGLGITREDAEELLQTAQHFVQQVSDYLQRQP